MRQEEVRAEQTRCTPVTIITTFSFYPPGEVVSPSFFHFGWQDHPPPGAAQTGPSCTLGLREYWSRTLWSFSPTPPWSSHSPADRISLHETQRSVCSRERGQNYGLAGEPGVWSQQGSPEGTGQLQDAAWSPADRAAVCNPAWGAGDNLLPAGGGSPQEAACSRWTGGDGNQVSRPVWL